ncbi:MAG: serine O-acetyltransferase [Dehalococcoidia bacterium]|nr:serine O-acetyltransferase [Dehalococcoidia bacterium]
MSVLDAIKRDIEAIRERDPAARGSLEVIFAYPGFHAREMHRLAHALHRRRVPVLPRVLSNLTRFATGIEIHPGARIGAGLFIDHGMGVVIGETAEIGDDCHILQDVTLGGTSLHRTKRHPTLGNGVTVGAGAKLIGAIEVGDHARIGAGSVVVTNVPENATVVGVPGHVVAFHDPGSDTITKLPDPEWDRIDVLEREIERMDRRLEALQAQLDRLGLQAERDAGDDGPRHLHRPRADDAPPPATADPAPASDSLPSREAIGG